MDAEWSSRTGRLGGTGSSPRGGRTHSRTWPPVTLETLTRPSSSGRPTDGRGAVSASPRPADARPVAKTARQYEEEPPVDQEVEADKGPEAKVTPDSYRAFDRTKRNLLSRPRTDEIARSRWSPTAAPNCSLGARPGSLRPTHAFRGRATLTSLRTSSREERVTVSTGTGAEFSEAVASRGSARSIARSCDCTSSLAE